MRVFRLAPLLLLLAACSRPDSSTAKAPEPSRPEPLPTGAPLGTAHPLGYLQSPPDAHWLAVRQLREDRNGDGRADSSPYLLFGPGPGERIDAFCASDPLGRYLVVVRQDSTWFIDSYTRVETRLGPRPNSLNPVFIGGGSLFEPPCAQFSADGRRLLFVRPRLGDGRLMLVVREVRGGSESTLDPGPGLLDAAQLDPTGQWVFSEAVEWDTDGDGTLSRIDRFDFGGAAVPDGDAPVHRVQRVDGRALREPDSLLVPLGSSTLRRGSRGELLVEDAPGQRTEWVPAECGAYLLHVDPVRELLLVACRNRGSPSPVELHGREVHQALGVTTHAGQFLEERFSSSTRLVTIAPVSPLSSIASSPSSPTPFSTSNGARCTRCTGRCSTPTAPGPWCSTRGSRSGSWTWSGASGPRSARAAGSPSGLSRLGGPSSSKGSWSTSRRDDCSEGPRRECSRWTSGDVCSAMT